MDKKEKMITAGAALFIGGFGMMFANALLPAFLGKAAEGVMELTTLAPLVCMPVGGLLVIYTVVAVRD